MFQPGTRTDTLIRFSTVAGERGSPDTWREPVLVRAFEYWHNVDKVIGDKIEQGVRAKQGEEDPKAADQGNPARSSMQAKV